jgi:hypothetical protein
VCQLLPSRFNRPGRISGLLFFVGLWFALLQGASAPRDEGQAEKGVTADALANHTSHQARSSVFAEVESDPRATTQAAIVSAVAMGILYAVLGVFFGGTLSLAAELWEAIGGP